MRTYYSSYSRCPRPLSRCELRWKPNYLSRLDDERHTANKWNSRAQQRCANSRDGATVFNERFERDGTGPSVPRESCLLVCGTGAHWLASFSRASRRKVDDVSPPSAAAIQRKKVGFGWPFLFRESTSLLLATKTPRPPVRIGSGGFPPAVESYSTHCVGACHSSQRSPRRFLGGIVRRFPST